MQPPCFCVGNDRCQKPLSVNYEMYTYHHAFQANSSTRAREFYRTCRSDKLRAKHGCSATHTGCCCLTSRATGHRERWRGCALSCELSYGQRWVVRARAVASKVGLPVTNLPRLLPMHDEFYVAVNTYPASIARYKIYLYIERYYSAFALPINLSGIPAMKLVAACTRM